MMKLSRKSCSVPDYFDTNELQYEENEQNLLGRKKNEIQNF